MTPITQFRFMDKVMKKTGTVVFVGFYLGTIQTRTYGIVHIGETLHGVIFMGQNFEPYHYETANPAVNVVIGEARKQPSREANV